MRRNSHFSLAVALMAGVATTMSFAMPADAAHAVQKKKKKKGKEAEAPKYELSDEFRSAAGLAQDALAGEDTAAMIKAVQPLEALAKTSDEKYFAGQINLNLASKTNDVAYQKKGLELSLLSERPSAADRGLYNATLGQMALINDRNNAAAQDYFAKAVAAGYSSNVMYYQYAEAKFGTAIDNSGGSSITSANAPIAQEGLTYLSRALELPDEKNRLNDADLYKRGAAIASAINSPDAISWVKNYVKTDQSPDSWRMALSTLRKQARYTNQDNLDLMRLMRRTKSMKTSSDYAEYVENADARSLPGEVESVLREGTAAGLVNTSDSYFSAALAITKNIVKQDRADLGASERSAQSASHGRIALATGDAYLGYGEASKAVGLYELALSKGDIDRDRALTRLGIAHADNGDYAAAREKFSMVSGVRKPLAEMWMLWVDQQDTQSNTASSTSAS